MRTTDAPRGECGAPAPRKGHDTTDRGPAGPSSGGDTPLTGVALLDRLRATGRPRPAADPTLVDELRSFLEDDLAVLDTHHPSPDEGRVVVTADRIERALSCRAHRWAEDGAGRSFSLPLACGALVGVLFRQLVTVGDITDPMAEALESLSLDDRQVPLVAWIEGLARAERAELAVEVTRQAQGLCDRWPPLDPSWLPRTDEVLRVPLAHGAVELTTRVDLAIGRPADGVATVALAEVASGARHPGQRHERGFDALIETLRSSVPPFAVATYFSRTGEIDVEPVDRELLVAAAKRCVAGARRLLGGDLPGGDAAWCAGCALRLRPIPVVLDGGATVSPGGAVAGVVDLARGQAA